MSHAETPAAPDHPGPDHRAPRPEVVPPAVRSWLYGVATAAIVLLSAYGLITAEHVPLWIALAGALFATTTATAYRPTKIRGKGQIGADE